MNPRATLTIACKDLLDAVRNLYILFGLTLPLGLALLFRLMFPTDGDDLTLKIVVWDPGNSQLVADLRSNPQVQVLEVHSAEQVPEEVESKAVGGLVIPDGFDTAAKAGEQPELIVYVNQRQGGGAIAAFQRLIEQQVWSLVDQEIPAHIVLKQVATLPGTQDQQEFNMERFLLIMLLLLALAMAGSFMVPTLLVEEKEKHTLEVLLAAPASPVDGIAGKAITGMVYSLLGAGILLVLHRSWSGDWLLTLITLSLGALFIVGVGLLMGALFHNTNQVNTWSSLVMLLLLFPSWIAAIGPIPSLEMIVRFIPTYYLARALQHTLAGDVQASLLIGDLAILLGCVLAVFAVVIWAIGRERS